MDKVKIFEGLLDKFETDEIRDYFQIISLQFQVAHHLSIIIKHSVSRMVRFFIF